ncbi:Uncharacterised protein [Legionella waltersii]|nr:Uncharacterised protein [Legionella waltersii]
MGTRVAFGLDNTYFRSYNDGCDESQQTTDKKSFPSGG